MHIFLIVLLCIVAVLVVLLLLLLFVPAQLLLEYKDDDITAKARVLFLTIKLYPRKQKPAKEPPQPKAEEKPPEPQPQKPKKKITLDKLTRAVKTAKGAMKIIFGRMKISFTKIVWPVYDGNAADTALAYGQLQAYVGGALGVLQQILNISFKSADIFADYDNIHEKERCIYCKIGATPFIMISAAIYVYTHLKRDKLI